VGATAPIPKLWHLAARAMYRSGMSARRFSKGLVAAGFVVGSVFGVIDLFLTWLDPVQDESPGALLVFYGPMFASWAIAGFVVARRAGPVSSGVVGGVAIAFATSVVFVVLKLVRVNLFLDQLVNRADWQNMMMRFKASGEALRLFVNVDYIRGAPFKIAVGVAIGALMGAAGSSVSWLVRGRRHELLR
jgi:hypothetical protein